MATIIQTPNGSWRVQVRRKGKYASRNFRLKGQAQTWSRKIEHVIDEGGEVIKQPSVWKLGFGVITHSGIPI